MLTTADQLRAARAMLRMEQTVLAERSGVSVETIKRLERLDGKLRAQKDTVDRIQRVLAREGIKFLEPGFVPDQKGPGVRLVSAAARTQQVEHLIGHGMYSMARVALDILRVEDPQLLAREPDEVAKRLRRKMTLEEFRKVVGIALSNNEWLTEALIRDTADLASGD